MGKKKEKVKYVDDGRTLADMSNVGGPRLSGRNGPRPDAKEVWKTYWSAVRMMVKPMLITIGVLCVVYILAMLALTYLAS